MNGERVKLQLLVWGAGLSAILALLKLWKVFWKDRKWLKTGYNFSGQNGQLNADLK